MRKRLMKMMSDDEFVKYHDERFAELPDWIIVKGSDTIREAISDMDKKLIRAAIADNPVHWIAPFHHGFGTAIRNLLRAAVCVDDELPAKNKKDKNWDNYYTYLIEIAVEARQYKPAGSIEKAG
jgi:hypothetical protein